MWTQPLRTWRKLAWYLLCACVGLLPLYALVKLAQAQATPQAPPFDYTVDRDGDGLPDELLAAMKHIHDLRKQGAAKEVVETERTQLLARLPYTKQTRTAMVKMEILSRQLKKAQSAAEWSATWQQVEVVVAELAQDPNYALTVETYERMLPDRKVVASDNAGQNGQVVMAAGINSADTFIYPLDQVTQDGQTLSAQSVDQATENLPAPTTNELSNHVYLPAVRAPLPMGQADDDSTAAAINQSLASNYHAYMPSIQRPNEINFANLQRGDVIFRWGPKSLGALFDYAKYYGHDGMIDGVQVYEANTDGVWLHTVSNWQQPSPEAVMRSNAGDPGAALTWAENFYGTNGRTGYNYIIVDKQTDSLLYCSQLTWKIFRHMNVEVDSGNQDYRDFLEAKYPLLGGTLVDGGVLPDEVYLDDSLNLIDRGLGKFAATP